MYFLCWLKFILFFFFFDKQERHIGWINDLLASMWLFFYFLFLFIVEDGLSFEYLIYIVYLYLCALRFGLKVIWGVLAKKSKWYIVWICETESSYFLEDERRFNIFPLLLLCFSCNFEAHGDLEKPDLAVYILCSV